MPRLTIIFLFFVLSLVGIIFLPTPKKDEVHYHAGFVVYVNGEKQDFSLSKYMHLEICDPSGAHKEDEQIEKAHLHSGVGDVVHVHRKNAYWRDLFHNIGYELPPGLPVVGLSEQETIPDFLNTPLYPNQSVIILVGQSPVPDLTSFISQEHIKEVENSSESCGS